MKRDLYIGCTQWWSGKNMSAKRASRGRGALALAEVAMSRNKTSNVETKQSFQLRSYILTKNIIKMHSFDDIFFYS